MKNLSKVLALVLVVAMVFSFAVSAGAAASYKDDASINYKEAVQLLSALDVLNGYDTTGDGKGDTFKPAGDITRAEFSVMVSYMVANGDSDFAQYNDIYQLNKDYAGLCTFADSKNHWAAGFIAFCAGNGFISGRDAKTFDPDATITVAEISVILLRVMGYDATVENFGTTANTTKGYNTQLTAKNAGLLDGMTNVSFFKAATREQAAQLMMNALSNYVVEYNGRDFQLVITDKDGNVTTVVPTGAKAVLTNKTLMNHCFKRVSKVNTVDAYGYWGHQWIAVSNSGIKTVVLTDVFVDDSVLATFKGGTKYSAIASALGVTSKSSPMDAVQYVNGYYVGTTTLNQFYMNGNDYTADNCTTVVVKVNDRSVAGTYYKVLSFYEYVATVTSSTGAITQITSPHYGEYYYTFDYEKNYQGVGVDNYVGYMYGEKDAYDTTAKYLVVPAFTANDIREAQLLPNTNTAVALLKIVDSYENITTTGDFLKITKAEVTNVLQITGAQKHTIIGGYKGFSDGSAYVYTDGSTTKTYDISEVFNDYTKTGVDYNKNVVLVKNSAGYVIAAVDTASTAYETGYVYLDRFEFAVTQSGNNAELINPSASTWAAQAKASVYFPTAEGTKTPTTIDIAIEKFASGGGKVEIQNANEYSDGAYVTSNATTNEVRLPIYSTTSFYDVTGTQYPYGDSSINGNTRVYSYAFDGWYAYTKYTDGTYALTPVGKDIIGVQKGSIYPTQGYSDSYLTSMTSLTAYTMDLATMTCSFANTTGYGNIATGVYGFNGYDTKVDGTTDLYPYKGNVGGEISRVADHTNNGTYRITEINDFNTVRATTNIKYALFASLGDYFPTAGKYQFNFFVDGGVKTLYGTAGTLKINGVIVSPNNQSALLASLTPKGAYQLQLNAAGEIEQISTWTLYGPVSVNVYADNANYIQFKGSDVSIPGISADVNDLIALQFDANQVYSYNDGTAMKATDGSTVYFVMNANGTSIAAMWVVPTSTDVPDPRH